MHKYYKSSHIYTALVTGKWIVEYKSEEKLTQLFKNGSKKIYHN